MSGFPSLGALQGQWPAREAAPRSSKLNSVTRAGQQHSTPTRDALTCAVTPTVTCPTTMHYYYYRATIRTFKLGDGWGGWLSKLAPFKQQWHISAPPFYPPST